jgi:hypothetical protein
MESKGGRPGAGDSEEKRSDEAEENSSEELSLEEEDDQSEQSGSSPTAANGAQAPAAPGAGYSWVRLGELKIDEDLIEDAGVTAEMAHEFGVFPIESGEDEIVVAVADLGSVWRLEKLAWHLRPRLLRFVAASEAEVKEFIEKWFGPAPAASEESALPPPSAEDGHEEEM